MTTQIKEEEKKKEIVEMLVNIVEEATRNIDADTTLSKYRIVYSYSNSVDRSIVSYLLGKEKEKRWVLLTLPKRIKGRHTGRSAIIQIICTGTKNEYNCYEVIDYIYVRNIEILDITPVKTQ